MGGDLDRLARDLDRILEVTRAMAGATRLEDLLDIILDAAKDLLEADRCSLFLVDAASGQLWTRIAQGSGTIRLPRGKGIAGTVATTGTLINIPDAYRDERFDRTNDASSGYRTRSILAMPLLSWEDQVVGVLQVLNKQGGGPFDAYDEHLATALCSQAAVAVDTAQLIERDRERQRLAQAMELAHDIQQGLLPHAYPQVPGWGFAHWQSPCDETGGDYHDYLPGHDGIDLVVGDVSGHGLGAALMMSTARASLRALAVAGGDPAALMARLNALLAEDMADDTFMTMLVCRLGGDGSVTYAAAGHEPPMVYRRGEDRFEELDSTGLMLGVIEDSDYEVCSVAPLAPGDLLLGYTDGIFEAHDGEGTEWGQAAVQQVVRDHAAEGAEGVLAALRDGVAAHMAGSPREDDMTVVVAERLA